jgi:hypothetical protein
VLFSPGGRVSGDEKPTEEARRHVEKAGGFSFIPPDGWKGRDLPGLKFKIFVGPVKGEFASNINVVDEATNATLAEYAKESLAHLKRVLKQLEVVKQEEFKTSAGLQGIRVIFTNNDSSKDIRQTSYLFGTADTKYVITCSTRAEGGEKLDPIFEKAMKSFKFEKP